MQLLDFGRVICITDADLKTIQESGELRENGCQIQLVTEERMQHLTRPMDAVTGKPLKVEEATSTPCVECGRL